MKDFLWNRYAFLPRLGYWLAASAGGFLLGGLIALALGATFIEGARVGFVGAAIGAALVFAP